MWGLGGPGGGHHHNRDDELQQRFQRADRQRQAAAAAATIALQRATIDLNDPTNAAARASSVGSVGAYGTSSYEDPSTAATVNSYFNRSMYGNQWSTTTGSTSSQTPTTAIAAAQIEILQAEERQRRQLEIALATNAMHEEERIRFEQHQQQTAALGYKRDVEASIAAATRDQYEPSIESKGRAMYDRQHQQEADRLRSYSNSDIPLKSYDEDISDENMVDSDINSSNHEGPSIEILEERLHKPMAQNITSHPTPHPPIEPSSEPSEITRQAPWQEVPTSNVGLKEEAVYEKVTEKKPIDKVAPTPTPVISASSKSPSTASTSSSAKKKKANNSSSKASKKTPAKSPKKGAAPKKKASNNDKNPPDLKSTQPALNIPNPDITTEEYKNLDSLMTQFCKVPLLSEFSRPISLLHPELVPIYSKIIKHPMDLGMVCRAIRRREYTNTRAVCIDMWRIFANCVKYHTHPLTREGAIVSFISIAMHLREYFNDLWYEYMVPSDIPTEKQTCPVMIALQNSDEKRIKARKQRLDYLSSTQLSPKFIVKIADAIETFVTLGGRVDALDKEPIDNNIESSDSQEIVYVFKELSELKNRLRSFSSESTPVEYTVDMLQTNIRNCYSSDIFTGSVSTRMIFARRLDRLVGKILVPINEVVSRGVNQSSVWGCMAAAIWARESTKRPYWPSLVLGILAPEDQKEEWHNYLTKRNETRLPEKLRQELQSGKKKAEQSIRRQSTGNAERMSFFLVEFLGTHEFIWVREADIIESFDPEEDPNSGGSVSSSKKKKTSLRGNTPANEKMRQRAVEEGRWALEEFEEQLNDPCGDMSDRATDADEEEENYSFTVLCASDDEADEADGASGVKSINEIAMPNSNGIDFEEINELLATDGILDYSADGRKHAKKRAAAFKKQQADAKREATKREKEEKARKAKLSKKAKEEIASKKKASATTNAKSKAKKNKVVKDVEEKKKEKDAPDKREDKELEKRRRKRERERERVLKEEHKSKKVKIERSNGIVKRGKKAGIADKRGRATAIVRGYLSNLAGNQDLRGLGLGGVLSMPAASVEGSGLLGLALAFRAAAGEIEMPNINNTSQSSNFNPWEKIDTHESKTSEARCKNLEEQIRLLEESMVKLEQNNVRRKKILEQVACEKVQVENDIAQAQKDARQNDMPKRKTCAKKKDPQKSDDKQIDGRCSPPTTLEAQTPQHEIEVEVSETTETVTFD